MSFKSKDLAYEKKQPAFLQRIRNAQVDSGVDTDRHGRQIARPRGAPKAGNDDDDAPTYVIDDSNNTLSKEEYEAMLARGKAEEDKKNKEVLAKEDERKPVPAIDDTEEGRAEARSKQEVTEVGQVQKKRKAARVIGGDDEEGQDEDSGGKTVKHLMKAKKKAKAVKLSFGD